ncbi:membrane protein [Candidatus Mancarchaeum acidiphilum]|uniref:Membrane protein n=1 Tax=Candidatus Mancarchaeum acidiphilum TaxID=1920749 RepID=A0A218NM72_9ARCH|nr:hypothetical protein [Candidatus Mancarchaeum acidiphilum]ASI13565.1 membrane protein [Candidatus Mancarchaeum acidiphilum]
MLRSHASKAVFAAVLLLLIIFLAYAYGSERLYGGPSVNTSIYSVNNINNFSEVYNTTLKYVTLVNKSSYIVFYPNLKGAYANLSKAKNLSKENPAVAYSLLEDSYKSASLQLKRIGTYRLPTLIILIVLTALSSLYLYYLMEPVKRQPKQKPYADVKKEKGEKPRKAASHRKNMAKRGKKGAKRTKK